MNQLALDFEQPARTKTVAALHYRDIAPSLNMLLIQRQAAANRRLGLNSQDPNARHYDLQIERVNQEIRNLLAL